MKLALVGISHHRAPVELRELVALPSEEARSLAGRLAARTGEAVCLSTCNRTELYLATEDAGRAEDDSAAELVGRSGLGSGELLPLLYRLGDEAAALHLFRVAAGLDSLVPGEGEILGQVRAAYEGGAPGPLLDRLFRQALHVGKKARTSTAIGESPASISSAAASLAEQVFDRLDGRPVLLVGAGKVGETTARALVARGATIAYVASRSPERARDLVGRFGGEAVELNGVEGALERVDVVVSCTAAQGIVLGRAEVAAAARARKGRPLFLIDIAVPRDLDPAIRELDGCYLYDIDDLESVVAESLAGRRREAVRAEEIVVAEAERFRAWQASLDVVPAITSLRRRAEEIRIAELAKAEGRLEGLSDAERRTVDSVTAGIVNKLLHLPTVRLKEAAAAEGPLYADAVRHLFGLGDDGPRSDRVER